MNFLDEENPEIKNFERKSGNNRKMVVRINRIVTELTDTVAIEQGRLALELTPVHLAPLMRESANCYFGKNDTNGNELVFDFDENLPPVCADCARIMQVMTNLLSNSLRHSKNRQNHRKPQRQQKLSDRDGFGQRRGNVRKHKIKGAGRLRFGKQGILAPRHRTFCVHRRGTRRKNTYRKHTRQRNGCFFSHFETGKNKRGGQINGRKRQKYS
ncbi:MAG: hypothetical protein L6V93_04715 [Clostridiales bacterium]|nr:MAG: hypothetical protein L6V93_04715 [Clostridiales bacterium]